MPLEDSAVQDLRQRPSGTLEIPGEGSRGVLAYWGRPQRSSIEMPSAVSQNQRDGEESAGKRETRERLMDAY